MVEFNPTPAFLANLYWITLFSVIVSSASGVLIAGFKQFDLFGVSIKIIDNEIANNEEARGDVLPNHFWMS